MIFAAPVARSWLRSQGLRVSACMALSSLLTMGCTTTDPGATDASTSSVYALVSVETSTESSANSAETPSRTLAEVRFLKTSEGIEPETFAHLLGDTLDVPERGSCVQGGDAPLSLPLHTLPTIELVDAGDVSITADSGPEIRLAARAYPDVAHLLSGVVYTSLEASTHTGSPSGSVLLKVSGGASVPAFSTSFEIPPSVSHVEIGGVPLGGTLAADANELDVVWQGAAANDQIVVDISELPSVVYDAPVTRWRCASSTGVDVRLPADVISPGGSARVEVHRLVEQPLRGHPVRSARASVDVITSGVIHRAIADNTNGG